MNPVPGFLSTPTTRLRIFLRYDRKLLGELAGCAWRVLKLYFGAYFDGAAAPWMVHVWLPAYNEQAIDDIFDRSHPSL